MQEKQAGFRYDRKQSTTYGFPVYYKPCLNNNKIYVGLDISPLRSSIAAFIGIEYPSFLWMLVNCLIEANHGMNIR